MMRHVLQCGRVPDEVKAKWQTIDAEKKQAQAKKLRTPQQLTTKKSGSSSMTINKRLFGTPRPSASKRSPHPPKKKTKEENFIRATADFYATGIPFRCVEGPLFRAMFTYELPSRHQLAEQLLDSIYHREKKCVVESLSGKQYLALVTDGWANPNNESIINFVLTNPHVPPVFWKSVSTRDAVHTANYTAQSISEVIDEVHAVVTEGAATSVVTDNAANIAGAGALLQRNRGLIWSGCSFHGMNFLIKDIFELEDFILVLKKATTLASFVKSRSALSVSRASKAIAAERLESRFIFSCTYAVVLE